MEERKRATKRYLSYLVEYLDDTYCCAEKRMNKSEH